MKATSILGAVILTVMCVFFTVAQIPTSMNKTSSSGQKEGQWTILFDENWKVVTDQSSAKYYRIINYTNGKPTGIVKDYYKSGKVQCEFKLLSDDPEVYADGVALWYYENGNKAQESIYKNGKVNGNSKSWYENGKLKSEGTILDTVQDGRWVYYHENGKLWSEMSYKEGKKWECFSNFDASGKPQSCGTIKNGNGIMISYYEKGGKMFESNFSNGIREGRSVDYYENGGKKAEGKYSNDLKDGPWNEWYDNGGKLSEGEYKKDIQNGTWKEWYKNGKIKEEGYYKNGHKEENWKEYYYVHDEKDKDSSVNVLLDALYFGPLKNGETWGEGKYKKGSKAGIWRYYDSKNNKVGEGSWSLMDASEIEKTDNQAEKVSKLTTSFVENTFNYGMFYIALAQDGPWTLWNSENKKTAEGRFISGKKEGKWTNWFYENGIYVEINYVQDKMAGKVYGYYLNGNEQSEGVLKEGKKTGFWKEFAEDGQYLEGSYEDGKKEGKWSLFDKYGKLQGEGWYRNDVLVK
ncbi:MAG: hypothetical protein NTU44_16100 [Bacteroidetes bacterium]|nr:hypothetical protein [Bacteroidota bacterium]